MGELFKPRDTQLLKDSRRGWLKTLLKRARSEIAAQLLSFTVGGEKDDVVGEDPAVQGELRELQLQILTDLWTASWNAKPAVGTSESECGCQGFEAVFITKQLMNPLW